MPLVKDKVCLLNKSLYDLKQAPCQWNERFTIFFKSRGLIATKTEKCIFRNEKNTLFIAFYVDDGLMIGSNENDMDDLLKM